MPRTPLNAGPEGPFDATPLCSDGDAEDGEQGPIWTFPPTIRPSPHSKLHKGMALHGPQKVWSRRPSPAVLGGRLCSPQASSFEEAQKRGGVERTCPAHPAVTLLLQSVEPVKRQPRSQCLSTLVRPVFGEVRARLGLLWGRRP